MIPRSRTRIVIDTNVYVSRFLRPSSIPGRAVERVLKNEIALISSSTMLELRGVLSRPKFTRYVNLTELQPFLNRVWDASIHIQVTSAIRACRHPVDDKFLELAVDGQADLILTGDQDLLTLHPFRGIAIVSPTAYLAED